uniref:Uncharacterized protein n=1 Tax=Lynx canadensis TaxID=61383 RepID=A0A667HWQ4_LYNCA
MWKRDNPLPGGCCWALTAFQKTKLGSPTRITLSPFLGLGVLLIKRACGPRKSWPHWLTPASCTVLLPLTSSPPTGQTTPALGHQLGGPTERKLSQAATRAFNFERPCYLRGGICLKQGTPDCEPFRGPCRAFTVCCKVKGLWGRAAAKKP